MRVGKAAKIALTMLDCIIPFLWAQVKEEGDRERHKYTNTNLKE